MILNPSCQTLADSTSVFSRFRDRERERERERDRERKIQKKKRERNYSCLVHQRIVCAEVEMESGWERWRRRRRGEWIETYDLPSRKRRRLRKE
jgi:hypothetical protein